MLRLQLIVYSTKKGDFQIQQEALVQEMDSKRFSYRGKRLVNAEFAAIVVAHNIRKMIAKGYCVCFEVAVG